MHLWLGLVLAAACSLPARPAPSNSSAAPADTTASRGHALVARELVESETGAAHRVWIAPGRESNVDNHDPCCGLSYDGNRYDDALASCAVRADECGAGKTAVYPGLADDRVCGPRRRCVPVPEVRVIVHDTTPVSGVDADERALAIGKGAALAYRAVSVGREGFVVITIAQRTERVAVDYGARYTIEVRGGGIERITRD